MIFSKSEQIEIRVDSQPNYFGFEGFYTVFKFICLVHTWLLCCQVARAVCSVFRLFGALSAHLRDIDSEDKAGVVRREEWSDVFVLSTHTAMSRTWRIIAGRLSFYVSLYWYFKIASFNQVNQKYDSNIFVPQYHLSWYQFTELPLLSVDYRIRN